MTTLEGNYFDGSQPVAWQARMDFMDREATLTSRLISERYETRHLRVSPRVDSTVRFINLPKGGQFACADDAFLDSLPQESKPEGTVAWLEERWIVALASVAIMAKMNRVINLKMLKAALEFKFKGKILESALDLINRVEEV